MRSLVLSALETNTCSCLGGTDCSVESEGEVTLVCEGNARCELDCNPDCTVECPGTAGCNALMGDQSTGVCGMSLEDCGDGLFVCRGTCP